MALTRTTAVKTLAG